MGLRRIHNGKEVIILREDRWGGFECIEVEKLTMKVSEVLPDADIPDQFRNMTFIAYIKFDAAGEDKMKWKQHRKAMKDEGHNI